MGSQRQKCLDFIVDGFKRQIFQPKSAERREAGTAATTGTQMPIILCALHACTALVAKVKVKSRGGTEWQSVKLQTLQ